MEEEAIEPDRYHAGHMYYYLLWLEDDITMDGKHDIKLKGMINEKEDGAQVKYKRLCMRVFESEAKHMEQHEIDMVSIRE